MNIGSAIHTQLKSTVYEMLASVSSLGQGEWDQRWEGWGWHRLRAGPTFTQARIPFASAAGPSHVFLVALSRILSLASRALRAVFLLTAEVPDPPPWGWRKGEGFCLPQGL